MSQTTAQILADYVVGLTYDDLPPSTVAAVKGALVDQLGIQLMGSTLPWTKPARDVILALGGRGEVTVVGHGDRLGAVDAATINANYAHSCELDDSGYSGGAHSGALSVPCAVALSELRHLSGRDLILGVALGYEVLHRIGRVLSRPAIELGFHHQGVVGPFGVAAVTSKLLGLSAEQTTHAFSIAGSHSSGVMEYDQAGGEVKRYHNAMATRAGMTSAYLAAAGLTGPPTIFEGPRGVVKMFGQVDDASHIVEGLEDHSWFAVERRTVKMYPSVGTVLTSIQAMARICQENDFNSSDVRSIDVWVQPNALMHGASIVHPTDTISAQFSLAFSLGLRIAKGRNDLADYRDPANWKDPDIYALAEKLHVLGDPSYGARDPAEGGTSINWATVNGARVRVELNDGRVFEADEPYRHGSVMNPVTPEDLAAKFRSLAAPVLDERAIVEVLATIDRLEELEDVSDLVRQLTVSAVRQS
jgi:2-methylcitrate dehydratase PrpD